MFLAIDLGIGSEIFGFGEVPVFKKIISISIGKILVASCIDYLGNSSGQIA